MKTSCIYWRGNADIGEDQEDYLTVRTSDVKGETQMGFDQ
jgi:hypothetical protein